MPAPATGCLLTDRLGPPPAHPLSSIAVEATFGSVSLESASKKGVLELVQVYEGV